MKAVMFNFIRILFIWLLLTGAVAAQDKKLESLPGDLRQQQGEIDPDGTRWLKRGTTPK